MNTELAEDIKRLYVCLAKIFENLPIDDKHRNMILHHMEYQILNASPTLEKIGALAIAKHVHNFMTETLKNGNPFTLFL